MRNEDFTEIITAVIKKLGFEIVIFFSVDRARSEFRDCHFERPNPCLLVLESLIITGVFSDSICEIFKKFGTLHDFACHPCAGAMLIFSVSFQF